MDFPLPAKSPQPGIKDILSSISSPKRKRDQDSDSDYDFNRPRASPMRFRTEVKLPTRPRIDDDSAPSSPRSSVSQQLHALKLDKPDLAFSTPIAAFGKDQSSADSSGSWNTSSPPTDQELEFLVRLESPTPSSPRMSRLGSIQTPTSRAEPPTTPPRSIQSATGQKSIASPRLRSPPPPSTPPSNQGYTSSSPSPLPQKVLTWSPSEITGHNPTDPTDDGYGINGVGFRPTPAIAQARSQRRKQQVAEWKSREAREARQKRIDRRRKVSTTTTTATTTTTSETDGLGSGSCDEEGRRRVRFVDI